MQGSQENNKYKEVQLTHAHQGHFLNPVQCFSPDGRWIVYDTRNDGGQIGSTGSIEMVHTQTGESKVLYHTTNQSEYGPGVGAAAFSPVADRVIFIHGIRNADRQRPYSFSRRTGVAIDIQEPEKPIFMDARDITAPFTPGALRGGTHAHSWSGDGQWLSFTYNDNVLETLSLSKPEIQDLRTVGVMFPGNVVVPNGADPENHSGNMFSVIVTEVTETPGPGGDEIEKAFDEGWIGKNGYLKPDGSRQKRAIAFQGNVRDDNGQIKTEVFVVDLPDDLTKAVGGRPLEGTAESRPNAPYGVNQRRITFSKDGVQGPRHWLQSTPNGSTIAFLAKDQTGYINVFGISPNGGAISQLTKHPFDLQSGVTFSPDGGRIAYIADNAVYITEVADGNTYKITARSTNETSPVGNAIWSPDGKMLAYNRYVTSVQGENYLQIFLCKLLF